MTIKRGYACRIHRYLHTNVHVHVTRRANAHRYFLSVLTGNSVHLDVVGMSEVNTTVCWRDTLVVKCTVTGSLHNATVTKHGRHLLYINGSLVGAELQHAVVHLQGEERFVISIEKFGLEMGTSILSCLYTANGLNSSSNSIKLYVTNCEFQIQTHYIRTYTYDRCNHVIPYRQVNLASIKFGKSVSKCY